jgi:hypothetical protein
MARQTKRPPKTTPPPAPPAEPIRIDLSNADLAPLTAALTQWLNRLEEYERAATAFAGNDAHAALAWQAAAGGVLAVERELTALGLGPLAPPKAGLTPPAAA